MQVWRARGKAIQGFQPRGTCLAARLPPLEAGAERALAALWTRHASPQPATYDSPAEDIAQVPARPRPTRFSTPEIAPVGKWDSFVYALYHIRAKASACAAAVQTAGPQNLRRAEAVHLTSLLPIISRQGRPLSEWIRQLRKELECQAMTRQKLEEKVGSILSRGGATELKSAQNLVRQLQEPLTNAIIREQRSGIKNHVQSELTKAKATRLRSQHAKLRKKLKSMKPEDMKKPFREWIRDVGIPLDTEIRSKEFDAQMLEACKAIRAHQLPDPAEGRPEFPLSDVAIIAYTDHDRKQAARTGSKTWSDPEEGMLDVVEARLKGLNVPKRKFLYNKRTLMQVTGLQDRLNRYLHAARLWSSEKLAKVGVRLIDITMQTIGIQLFNVQTQQLETRPFLEHHVIHDKRHKKHAVGTLRLHDAIVDQIVQIQDLLYLQGTVYDPMLVTPLPWRGLFFGGYLLQHEMMVRLKSRAAQLPALLEADQRGAGYVKLCGALNCLQSVPWRINQPVYEVARSIWESKGEVCGMPRRRNLPIIRPKKRPRFMTWLGGNVEVKASRFHKAEEDLLSAVEHAARETAAAAEEAEKDPRDNPVARQRVQEVLDVVSAHVRNMEPNLPSLISGADEGSELWRDRDKEWGVRKRFMRKQLLATMSDGETLQEIKIRRVQNADIRKLNREAYSQLCDMGVKMAVAAAHKDEKKLYFPHNLDFRGRAYTLHPHLSHLGNDVCRGMLEFADGKPLGENGLDWLFIKVANCWGQGEDKKSLGGRREFVTNNLLNILESARVPLEHRWWQQAEDPFQLLSAIMDIRGALLSGDPASYVSHCPIMMDGSCNGLQHYAALGRDRGGGAAVNLLDSDKPQDVYTEVVRLVKDSAQQDALNGNATAQELLSNFDRKLVKQTVMTSVYGVTLLGARDQIASKLRDRGFDKRYAKEAGLFAAAKTLEGLSARFKQAMQVMAWLNDSARSIAVSGETVMWRTPLGLPVVQPYRKPPQLHVQTTLQRVILNAEVENARINRGKQRSAFPPNFIHSIDSSHMLMTAAACKQAGLTFAGVHDSFWTHPVDVPAMSFILREQFINLYSQPILKHLRDHFKERYPGAKLPELPQAGDLDLNEVQNSTYFFS